MRESDIAGIFAAIKAADPTRIATASLASVDDAQFASAFTARVGLDVTAYHDPRSRRWYQLGVIQPIVSTLRSNGKPAYLQEPMPSRGDPLFAYPSNDRAEYFLQAIANAKATGAAAWCFHTAVADDFRTGPPFVEDRLRAYPEPEWAFVTSLRPRVVFRTNNGLNYLGAEAGGGAGVRADRTAASPGGWDVLVVIDLPGGPIISGDRVAFMAANGKHYLQAVGGGGGALRASSDSLGTLETFTIEKPGGGVVYDGDSISLRAGNSFWYVVADGGGGGNVNVNSASRGAWEMFIVFFVTPHATASSGGASLRPRTEGRQ
jgi:hypothetical protein